MSKNIGIKLNRKASGKNLPSRLNTVASCLSKVLPISLLSTACFLGVAGDANATVTVSVVNIFAQNTSENETSIAEILSPFYTIANNPDLFTESNVTGSIASETFTTNTTIDANGKSINLTDATNPSSEVLIEFTPATSTDSLTLANFGSWTGNWQDYFAIASNGSMVAAFKNISADDVTEYTFLNESMIASDGISGINNATLIKATSGDVTLDNVLILNTVGQTDGKSLIDVDTSGTLKLNKVAVVNKSGNEYLADEYGNSPVVTLEAEKNIITNSLFYNVASPLYSLGVKAKYIYIANTAIVANKDNKDTSDTNSRWGNALSVYHSDSDLEVVIKDSYVGQNESQHRSGLSFYNAGKKFYISDTTFENNVDSESTNGLWLYPKAGASITIRDSKFINDGVMLYGVGTDTTLNIIADNAPTSFTDQESRTSDITVANAKVYINASEGQYVEFNAGITGLLGTVETPVDGQSTDLLEVAVTATEGSSYIPVYINASDVNYSYTDYSEETGETAEVSKTAGRGGEVRLYGQMQNLDIHTYGGSLRVLAPQEEQSLSLDTSAKASLTDLISDDKHFTNINLLKSNLTIDEATTLKTQSVDPLTHEAKSMTDEVALLEIMDAVQLQTVYLGKKLTLNSNLYVQPAVDLEQAVADHYTVGDGGVVVNNGSKIIVNGWIVKADRNSQTEVTVSLTPDGDTRLNSYFDLDSGASEAYGPMYVWNVKQIAGTAQYVFTREKPEDALNDDNVKDDLEKEIDNEIKEIQDEVDAGLISEQEAQKKLDELKKLRSQIESYSNGYEDTPLNYNPDVYGEQVAGLGISIIQHAISDSVFSEMRIGQLSHLITGEKPERKEWWGKVVGSDLDLKTKNFYNVDVSYGVGMIGHQFSPVDTKIGTFDFGVYVGAATATEKYSISKVKQNGGFAGASVLYEAGNAWLGVHGNFGVMSNRLKGITDNKTTNPWFAVGLTTGYNVVVPKLRMSVAPFVDMSYVAVKAKEYTTNLGAEVKNSSLHSFEISPGFSIDKQFDQGWGFHGQVRYAIVTKHDGKTDASYADGDYAALPCITNKNYVEYGIGVLKQVNNWGVSMNVNRSDGGRSGWSGMARLSYHF